MNALAYQVNFSPRRAACECGSGCSATVAITRSQLARARLRGGALIAHAHLSRDDEVVGIADRFLVIAVRRQKERK